MYIFKNRYFSNFFIIYYILYILCYVLCVMCYVLCVMCYVLCIMCYVLCVMCYVLCIICYVLCSITEEEALCQIRWSHCGIVCPRVAESYRCSRGC